MAWQTNGPMTADVLPIFITLSVRDAHKQLRKVLPQRTEKRRRTCQKDSHSGP
jgi:hypothetical protein